jgi:hypothetical protein
VVSVSFIKPYKARVGQAPTPIIVNSELEFEVEDTTDFNIVKSNRKAIPPVVEFRVRWKVLMILGMSHRIWPRWLIHCVLVCTLFSKRGRVRVLRVFSADSLALLPPHVGEQAQSTSKSVSFAAAGCLGATGELDRVLAALLHSQPAPKKVRAKVKTIRKKGRSE